MPHVHLPAHHRDEDVALAGALAVLLESDELYVAWSLHAGPGEPTVAARLHEPKPLFDAPLTRPERPWSAVLARLASLFGRPAWQVAVRR